MTKRTRSRRWQSLIQGARLWIFAIALTVAFTAILSFNLVTAAQLDVAVGQPVANDILAPRSVTYVSDILTERARAQALSAIEDVYTQLDPDIGRGQLELVRAVFSFLDVVRSDPQASTETKLSYIQAVDPLTVNAEIAETLLTLNSTDFEVVRGEVLRVVGEVMRQDIRDSQLGEYRRRASREVRLDLTVTQTAVAANLAPQFIIPTIFFNDVETEANRAAALAAVEPQVRVINKDERILRAGDVVREEDQEALIQLGLLQAETDWRDVASVFMLSLLSVVVITLHWQQYHQKLWMENGRYLLALFGILVVFVALAKLALSGGELVYWFPIAALAMLLNVIFDVRLSLIATLMVSIIFGYVSPNSLELMLYAASGGLLASLTLRDAQRINAFFRAGLIAAVGHIMVVLIFGLTQEFIDLAPLLQTVLFALANGILSAALTLAGFFLMGSLLGLTTTLQLQDLARLDHPLLQELLRRAPGTYHHSIMVANLAEQAAEEVRANSALIRVGAFYHDIGKMNRPPFFTENQEGVNPHDSLDPYTSARIILSHVTDGLELARRYKLPDRIRAFIAEHHGTRLVKGFYFKAREQAEARGDEVDKAQFRYAGPRPQTRETAIVMLADAVESTSRALQPDSSKAIEKLVNTLIDEDLTDGQLDNSGLTLGDIRLIRDSFIKTLKGRFHVRVKYPGNEELLGDGPQPAQRGQASVPQTAPAPQTPSAEETPDMSDVLETSVDEPATVETSARPAQDGS